MKDKIYHDYLNKTYIISSIKDSDVMLEGFGETSISDIIPA